MSLDGHPQEVIFTEIDPSRFIINKADVSVLRLMCSFQDLEFGQKASKALERNYKNGRTINTGLSHLVNYLSRPDCYCFNVNDVPFVVNDVEICHLSVGVFTEALHFMKFAVSFIDFFCK